MRKRVGILFIVICMVVCLIPFVGMTFFRTDTTTENKTLAEFPSLVEDGALNLDFTDELGAYFEDHFAFRQQLVNTDALIQSKVFDESNVDTVTNGSDGWLYYTATVDDYLGQNLMSEQAVYNAARNLALTQTYVESQGAQFAITVPANKNSLYGENMPYYDSRIVSTEKNIEYLKAELERQGVHYIDLFTPFEEEDEVLYLKRDSHWNEKGAVLAYNTILGEMEIEHDTLDDVPVSRSKTEIGDLNSMVFPLTAQPEWNYNYEYKETYTYTTPTESVEDAWIATENAEGNGSLLMFRDSFGNTLLPLMANTFSEAYFSKGEPYLIGLYMGLYQPETVIVEKVERNISEFAGDPPVLPGIAADLPEAIADSESAATCTVEASMNDMTYVSIGGVLDEAWSGSLSNVYVRLSSGDTAKTVEAFLISSEETDYGYQAYLAKQDLLDLFPDACDNIQVEVIAGTGDAAYTVYSEAMDFTEAVSTEIVFE